MVEGRQGLDWDYEDSEVATSIPVCYDGIEEYLLREYVLTAAETWSNPQIRAYLERF